MSLKQPTFIIVMGVSGCGKSTIGEGIAKALDLPYIDGDSLHPQANIDKMSHGTPLDDEDRWPWLRRIRGEALKLLRKEKEDQEHAENSELEAEKHGHEDEEAEKTITRTEGLVVACSSLKKSYRELLRGIDNEHLQLQTTVEPSSPSHDPWNFNTRFIWIDGNESTLFDRMSKREGHYMKKEMLQSQLRTLERPNLTEEKDIIVVRLEESKEEQLKEALDGLERLDGQ